MNGNSNSNSNSNRNRNSAAKKAGRPSDYNPDIADKLCRTIATSSEGLRAICRRNPRFPSRATIYRWLEDNPTFRGLYAHARELQAQAIFDEILEIADRPQTGAVIKIAANGKRSRRIGDMTEHRKLQVDARKWVLSKLLPRKYGEKLELDDGRQDPLLELVEGMREMSARIGPPPGMLTRAQLTDGDNEAEEI